MNAPTYINNTHKALSRNPGGLTLEELSGKLRAKALKVSQQIRELHDAGLIETTEDAGQPVYKLKAAPAAKSGRADIQPPQYDPASVAFPAKEPVDAMGIPISCGKPLCSPGDHHLLCKLHTSDSESAPSGLLIVKDGETLKAASKAERVLTPEAEAEREDFEANYGMLGNCSCHISPPCGSCIHPGNPRNQEEDETAWMAAGDSEGCESAQSECITSAPDNPPDADPALLASANRALGEQLEAAEQLVTARGHTINSLRMEIADLRERLHQQIEQWQTDTGRLTADLRAAIEARSQAISDAVWLRAELAAERQARKALQEQAGTIPAASRYLVVSGGDRSFVTHKLETARKDAERLARNTKLRADVFALIPVGSARIAPSVQWKPSR